MTTWPQTCNYCGAPLAGTRCPRCKFQRDKPGVVTFSGYTSGTELERIAKGTATGVTSATLTGVTLQPGSWLIVGQTQIQNEQGGNAIATWNGISMAKTSTLQHVTVDCSIFGLHSPGGGTGSLIVSDTESQILPTGMSFWATEWRGLTQSPADVTQSSLGHPSAENLNEIDFSTTSATISQAREVIVACENVFRPRTDPGTVSSGWTIGQEFEDTHQEENMTFTGFFLREIYRVVSAVGQYTVSIDRTTGGEWLMPMQTLRVES